MSAHAGMARHHVPRGLATCPRRRACSVTTHRADRQRSTWHDTQYLRSRVQAILAPVLTGLAKIDSLQIVEQLRSSSANHSHVNTRDNNPHVTALPVIPTHRSP
jgi:hypothetical protein